MLRSLFITATLVSSFALLAQCPFTPTVFGDTLVCPNEGALLSTQAYDTYQWYRRDFLAATAEPVAEATAQTISVAAESLPAFYSVTATLNACTVRSAEVLVDGLLFLLPFVIQEGEYTFDPNSETFSICEGDTLFLELGQPYRTSITWYRDGNPIPTATGFRYAITTAGAYTVEAAPEICPNFIQPLGLTLQVSSRSCETTTLELSKTPSVQLFPNPSSGLVQLRTQGGTLEHYQVFNAQGQQLQSGPCQAVELQTIDLSTLPAAVYWLQLHSRQGVIQQRLLLRP